MKFSKDFIFSMSNFVGLYVNLINELVTLGIGLKEPLDMSKSFLGFANSSVCNERILLFGAFEIYFIATSLCIMKYADVLN
jgi:hypothetical protein